MHRGDFSWEHLPIEIFYLYFSRFEPIWATDKQAKVFRNIFRFLRDIRLQSFLRGFRKFCLVNQHFKLQICSLMMIHTAEIDLAVWCTAEIVSIEWCKPRSFLKMLISRKNGKILWKYFSLFVRGPYELQSWKNLVIHSL